MASYQFFLLISPTVLPLSSSFFLVLFSHLLSAALTVSPFSLLCLSPSPGSFLGLLFSFHIFLPFFALCHFPFSCFWGSLFFSPVLQFFLTHSDFFFQPVMGIFSLLVSVMSDFVIGFNHFPFPSHPLMLTLQHFQNRPSPSFSPFQNMHHSDLCFACQWVTYIKVVQRSRMVRNLIDIIWYLALYLKGLKILTSKVR